jgi:hypothetical protein
MSDSILTEKQLETDPESKSKDVWSSAQKEPSNLLFCRDGLWGMIPYSLREGIWKICRRYSYLLATMYEMLHECRNLAFRIRMLWNVRHRLSIGNSLGPFFGENQHGHPVGCTRTLGCIPTPLPEPSPIKFSA